jgi:prolyl-tRNA synthetase
MKMSQLFSTTQREVSADAEVASHQLLLRAGYIRQLASGIFSYLPLALRSLRKVEDLLRAEMEAIGGQEISMPVVHPAEIWQRTGRYYEIGSEMSRFKDKNDRDMVLAMTHEEVVAELVSREIKSYRQLPQLVYQLQTKWRDDPRPRSGLIRVREFTMKDSYSLDADWQGLEKQYRAHYQAYFNIFNRCGIDSIAVASDTGMMGGKVAHEYMYLTPIGEDTLLLCDACNYSANRQVATFKRAEAVAEEPLEIEKIATPDTATIKALAELLEVPARRTAKAVFMMATIGDGEEQEDKFVLAVVRGDMEVNETKLANAVKAREMWAANAEEIVAVGAVPGYGSPVGVKGALVVVDEGVAESANLVAGANEAGFHLKNVNCGRDYEADIVTDIAAAQEGDGCPRCGVAMRTSRGVEVGNIFQLGTKYTEAMGGSFLDANGKAQPVIMGSYGIGVGRLLACVAEEYHDDNGLVWPISVAPYQVLITLLAKGEGETQDAAEKLYADLEARGIEVLLDDRRENPGVKFKDADLIGIPVRVTVGDRGLKNGLVEFKLRRDVDRSELPLAEAVDHIVAEVRKLEAELAARAIDVEYQE